MSVGYLESQNGDNRWLECVNRCGLDGSLFHKLGRISAAGI